MKIKHYLTAVAIAAGGAAIFTLLLWLTSLIGWAVVWAGLLLYALPMTYKLSQEFYESGEYYFTNFLERKIQEEFEEKSKESNIEL